ncbi:hypothetical protein K501DRAFT_310633 [Backusella circina FSU 941]|nr:hypothetical protein K501DRAFT_310633 [Backusella circina FSU 941]
MSDPSISHNMADINVPRQMFTQEEVDKIVAEVTKRVRETQLEESNRRQEGSDLPSEIYEGLEEYSPTELQRALQKFKRGTHKYNNRNTLSTHRSHFNSLKYRDSHLSTTLLTSNTHYIQITIRIIEFLNYTMVEAFTFFIFFLLGSR